MAITHKYQQQKQIRFGTSHRNEFNVTQSSAKAVCARYQPQDTIKTGLDGGLNVTISALNTCSWAVGVEGIAQLARVWDWGTLERGNRILVTDITFRCVAINFPAGYNLQCHQRAVPITPCPSMAEWLGCLTFF